MDIRGSKVRRFLTPDRSRSHQNHPESLGNKGGICCNQGFPGRAGEGRSRQSWL